nr:uncharacterized protein LOC109159588 isoform X1 [Ipomoea batatas]GMD36045.1 uncharacterized protein LOC109159588 isoform X1 [Ipomoea batatas]GMD39380.1 uncharacterized protein LOC109159588 isoform X1 [Ipomoea batatas]
MWRDKFRDASPQSLVSSKSDHMSILLVVEAEPVVSSQGKIQLRKPLVGVAVWRWGRGLTINFKQMIEYWLKRREILKGKTDNFGCAMFKEAQYQHLKALEHQNT